MGQSGSISVLKSLYSGFAYSVLCICPTILRSHWWPRRTERCDGNDSYWRYNDHCAGLTIKHLAPVLKLYTAFGAPKRTSCRNCYDGRGAVWLRREIDWL